MSNINFNNIFEREQIASDIKNILLSFDANCKNLNFKKGIYIYGSPGSGKTQFVMNLLTELNYDIIKYDAGDVRNKSLIDTITTNNVSNRNVLDMMRRQVKKIAIVMDEIDGMNNGDKGGITALIKIIRQKKTKKQRLENMTMNPIICIGNYYIDKKIKELMKVCNTFELKTPSSQQMNKLLLQTIPAIIKKPEYNETILKYIQGDLRKYIFINDIFKKKPELITDETLNNIFNIKSYNEDSKKITQKLINKPVKMDQHNRFMNETDRTIVALLWHENIVDVLSSKSINASFPFYLKILKNICFADYIDRITFQSQIWQFNEMSSLIKTFKNNKMYARSL
jgi:Cdc6-like AAA superfamily ATPase